MPNKQYPQPISSSLSSWISSYVPAFLNIVILFCITIVLLHSPLKNPPNIQLLTKPFRFIWNENNLNENDAATKEYNSKACCPNGQVIAQNLPSTSRSNRNGPQTSTPPNAAAAVAATDTASAAAAAAATRQTKSQKNKDKGYKYFFGGNNNNNQIGVGNVNGGISGCNNNNHQ